MVINIALFSFSANQITLSGLSPPFLGQSNYSDLSPFGVSQNFGTPSGANNIIYSFHFYAIKNVEIIGDTTSLFAMDIIETIELMDKPQN